MEAPRYRYERSSLLTISSVEMCFSSLHFTLINRTTQPPSLNVFYFHQFMVGLFPRSPLFAQMPLAKMGSGGLYFGRRVSLETGKKYECKRTRRKYLQGLCRVPSTSFCGMRLWSKPEQAISELLLPFSLLDGS